MRTLALALAVSLAILAGCGGSSRPDAGRRDAGPTPDADWAHMDAFVPPVGSCLDGSECSEYRDFTEAELEMTFRPTCMGDWMSHECGRDRDLAERIVGGCRTDDPDGTGYYILWLLDPAYSASGARQLCELSDREFVPAP